VQTKLLRHLYPQFETALRRLHSLERERATRTALESFLSRLPLPTMLLRWNLRLAYQNKAAREFCNLWAVGPELRRSPKLMGRCRLRFSTDVAASRRNGDNHRNWPHLGWFCGRRSFIIPNGRSCVRP